MDRSRQQEEECSYNYSKNMCEILVDQLATKGTQGREGKHGATEFQQLTH